jgi:chaperone modulatory protein CbpM
MNIDEFVAQIEIERAVVEFYLSRSWIKPQEKDGGEFFSELDKARLELIYTLQNDYELSDDAIDVILPLLDQVYGLRSQMRQLTDAIEHQPRRIQAEIFAYLNRDSSPN